MELTKKSKLMLFPRFNKWFIVIFLVVLAIGGLRAYQLYQYIFEPNILNPGSILIPKNATYKQVLDSLKKHEIIADYYAFDWVAKRKNYPELIKPGKYLLDKGLNTNEILNMLRSGNQHPVQVTFNNFIACLFQIPMSFTGPPQLISFLSVCQWSTSGSGTKSGEIKLLLWA